MTQPLPRRSEERGGAPKGYVPKGEREWQAGRPEPYLPTVAGTVLPAVVTLGWAAALAMVGLEDLPVPAWISAVYCGVGLLAAIGWLATTGRANRWFNAYLWVTSHEARLRIPARELPAAVLELTPQQVEP